MHPKKAHKLSGQSSCSAPNRFTHPYWSQGFSSEGNAIFRTFDSSYCLRVTFFPLKPKKQEITAIFSCLTITRMEKVDTSPIKAENNPQKMRWHRYHYSSKENNESGVDTPLTNTWNIWNFKLSSTLNPDDQTSYWQMWSEKVKVGVKTSTSSHSIS